MKISSNLHAMSTYSESYVKQNKTNSKKSETDKLNASKENFCNDRIVTGQGARTAEECGLVTGKNFANKTTVAGADGSIFTVSSYYDASSYVNDIMQAKTNYLVQRQNEWVASNLSEVSSEVNGNLTGREKYYSLGSYKIATDMDLANEIKDIFSNVDYSDENTLSSALQRYKDILRPIKLADGTDASKISQVLQKNANNIVSMYVGCLNTLSGIDNSGKIDVFV